MKRIKTQKEILEYLQTYRFTCIDRVLIAKLLQKEYRQGFLNGQKFKIK